ncbi:MAG: cupin domain-containing protein [Candidatus Didemnitutus sp.]|nr:cupin domain-containing protein [Candidatus Didemnitutus sp.]
MKPTALLRSRLLPLLGFAALHSLAVAATPAVTRQDLLNAVIDPARSVASIAIKRVTLQPHSPTGLHLHPCPVIGVVMEGEILFQLEGGPRQILRAGDAVHEPANARVLHFDNIGDRPAILTACYLLAPDQHELIRLLLQ